MKGTIVNYRRGRRTMKGDQVILEFEGFDDRKKASSLLGKQVLWRTSANREIHGKILRQHGNSGAVRAKFNRGLPGQAIGTKVEVIEKKEKATKPEPKPAAEPAKKKPAKKKPAKKKPAKKKPAKKKAK
jgi:large subunit ribosomal protein L35Ae